MHDALIEPEVDNTIWIKDDLGLFLDHWIIVRKDGTPVLNGKEQEFEQALRRLISKERQKAINVRNWEHFDLWTNTFDDEHF